MYDDTGRVREGYGTIGDIGTGPTRPVIGSPTPGSTKHTKSGGGSTSTATTGDQSTNVEQQGELQVQGVIDDPTDLVKANPYRYGGYRYDRDTQYYYLQARYYDGRLARFLSPDTRMGDVSNPLSLNRYIYAVNNPTNFLDPTGHWIAVIDTRDGGASVEPAAADLNKDADEQYVRAWGFTADAVKYYGVPLLKQAVDSGKLTFDIMVAANEQAKIGVKLGQTYKNVKRPWQSDPIGKLLMTEDLVKPEGMTQAEYAAEKHREAAQLIAAPRPTTASADPQVRITQIQDFFSKYGRSSACSGSAQFGCGQAILDFTQWEFDSGRLAVSGNYWNTVNQAMTQDLLDAKFAYENGLSKTGSKAGDLWLALIKNPSPETFWPAHTASLLIGHFSTAGLAAWQKETAGEQDFIVKIVLPAAVQVGPNSMKAGRSSFLWDPSQPGVWTFVHGFYGPAFPYTPPKG